MVFVIASLSVRALMSLKSSWCVRTVSLSSLLDETVYASLYVMNDGPRSLQFFA